MENEDEHRCEDQETCDGTSHVVVCPHGEHSEACPEAGSWKEESWSRGRSCEDE